jgi:hypothetical protein
MATDLNKETQSLAKFVETLGFDDKLTPGFLRESMVLINRGDRTIILVGDDADRYTEIKAAIYQALVERGRPVSKRAVNSLIDDFLLRTAIHTESAENATLDKRLKDEIQALKTGLFEKPRDWEVQRVVEGLAPSGLPISIGNVEFQFLDEQSLAALKTKTSARVRALRPKGDVEAAVAGIEAQLARKGNRDAFRERS